MSWARTLGAMLGALCFTSVAWWISSTSWFELEWKPIGPMLEDIRSAVKYVKNRWKLKCRANDMEDCLIAHDIPSQWSSTYVIMEWLLPYAEIFTTFIHEELIGGEQNLVISDQHWVVAWAICEILKVHYSGRFTSRTLRSRLLT